MVQVLSLVGDLQTGTAHAKVHTVHINLSRMRLLCACCCHVGVFITVKGHPDVDFFLATLEDRLGQTQETWMWARCLLRDVALVRVLISVLNALLE